MSFKNVNPRKITINKCDRNLGEHKIKLNIQHTENTENRESEIVNNPFPYTYPPRIIYVPVEQPTPKVHTTISANPILGSFVLTILIIFIIGVVTPASPLYNSQIALQIYNVLSIITDFTRMI